LSKAEKSLFWGKARDKNASGGGGSLRVEGVEGG